MRRPCVSLSSESWETERLFSSSSIANHLILPNTNEKIQVEGKPEDKMASDEDYMAFLDKANQDPNEGVAREQSNGGGKVELKATDKGVTVPEVLKKATKEAFYVSDADEPFVPVCLKFGGKGLPDEGLFSSIFSRCRSCCLLDERRKC